MQFRLRHRSPIRGHNAAGDTLFFHVQPANQQPTITDVDVCHKTVDTLGSLKHVSFDINHLDQLITPDYILNATQMTKAATKHVKTTSFPLPIYSTLKFTYVIKYDRRPHSDTEQPTNCSTYSTTPLHKQANTAMAY